jgi:hypothetical protein
MDTDLAKFTELKLKADIRKDNTISSLTNCNVQLSQKLRDLQNQLEAAKLLLSKYKDDNRSLILEVQYFKSLNESYTK